MEELISCVVVLVVLILFPIGQLIGYKCIQPQPEPDMGDGADPNRNVKIWPKWLEFMNYGRLVLVAMLLAFNVTFVNDIPLYFVYVVFIAYDVPFLIFYEF